MKVGSRYRSKNTTVEVIVVKGAGPDLVLTCAGEEMVDASAGPRPAPGKNAPDATADDRLLLGKRYVDTQKSVEVLCTVAGAGPVCVNGRRLELAEAKLLPSSD